MNILITTSTFPTWRKDNDRRFIYDFAKNLSEFDGKIKVTVLAPHILGSKRKETKKRIKIYRFVYFLKKWQNLCYNNGILANLKTNKLNYLLIPFFLIGEILAIKKICRVEKIDIIHANWLIPQGLAAVIYKKIFNKKAKIICTVHGSDINSFNGLFSRKIKKIILKNIDYIIAVSFDLKNQINLPDKTTVISPGLNLKKFKPAPPSPQLKQQLNITNKCLLFVGRLVPSKGVEYLIKALVPVSKVYPDLKLLIIGDGPEAARLKKLTLKLNLKNNIKFLGSQNNQDLPTYYNLADIFIGPSLQEGFGIVFLEALACGTPIIASEVGGIKDIIKANQNGLLIKPADWKELAQKIIELLADKGKSTKLSQTGQKFVQQFSWENNLKKHLQIYQKINLKN